MADNTFRPYRSRDPVAPRGADPAARAQVDDPLAELARLIGQSEPMNNRDARRGFAPAPEDTAENLDWAAGDGHAEQSAPAEDDYDQHYDERDEHQERVEHEERQERHEPRFADPFPPPRSAPSARDAGYGAPAGGQYSAPAPRLDAARDDARNYAVAEQPRYRGGQDRPAASARALPALPPQPPDDHFDDELPEHGADEQPYQLEDYEEDAPGGRRRGGLIVVAAVLGLAILGTAGAFAYRAMFGGSMLPSLPPIIKAEDGPNRIIPASTAKRDAPDQADAGSAGSHEKLVPREEQPIDVPTPVNPAPRVVSTIPIFPDPNGAQAGMMSGGQLLPAPAGSHVAPAPVTQAAPPPGSGLVTGNPPVPAAGNPSQGQSMGQLVGGLPAPKKIHTVAIHPDDMGGGNSQAATPMPPQAAPAPAPQAAAPAPAPASVRTVPPRAAAQPAPRPAPAASNAPLSIIPDQGGAAPAAAPPPVRTRTVLSEPMPLNGTAEGRAAPMSRSMSAPVSSAGGSYAVQVTSQRSEADAQAEFRALRAKFPGQIGDRQPIVRRADLGSKGVYYRALVGPFASMEQAAAMCSSLKAAGGTCIVQKD